ncbi:predicted ABC-type transport system involved in lysophospholipase L1 biosynthesis, ATPase component [Hahella chejuensis KCTC 2396]|uniref:Predicted ABC-type transport system involved in lysophospholipase L1 biosynthesis, ATPase component n=1 Tax=Hahella chejuensis (strain KCTC 2396) TaxID=349521 RepID=Q2SCI3_HAHCH|nr:ABC transporter ATP-binding protein [Hahella chejuensis]ABC31641.1 predicted ABC-type transport system involved in lysophospholipase L1 biosynthesis, ATPase component [Hahella chejuensis KCTC 2396]
MTSVDVLEVKSLTKSVSNGSGRLDILKGVDLQIKVGESLAIIGRSGSGKTTLLSIMAGLDLPSAGQVRMLGKDLAQLDEDGRAAIRAQHVGFVFQSFQLIPTMTALENVMLPLDLAGVAESRERARDWLDRVGLLEREGHYPRQLSGGEQQRVAVARAFATEPDILFADEPTGNLDLETGQHIMDLLFDLNKQHSTTLILVTHDRELAGRCGRSLALDQGVLEMA